MSYLFLGIGVCAASPVYFACANVKDKCIKALSGKKDGGGVTGREARAADMSVAGDVRDGIGNCVHTLRVLMRNFNGKLFFDGENNLGERGVKDEQRQEVIAKTNAGTERTEQHQKEARRIRIGGRRRREGGGLRYFNDVQGIQAEVIGEVRRGSDLHRVSGGQVQMRENLKQRKKDGIS